MTDEERTTRMTAQAFGLVLLAAVMVTVVVLSLILFDESEELGMFLATTVVAGAGAFLVWRFNTLWARILGLVITLAVAFTSFFFVFGVFQPFSPLEFIIGIGWAFGFFFALIGGVAGLFKRHSEPRKRLQTGALALIGVLSVVSIGGFLFTRSSVSDADQAGATVLDMENFEFAPGLTTVASGDKLLLTNSDLFAHDLTLDEYEIYVHLGPGGESLVDLSSLEPGTYQYWCSLHTFEEDGVKEGMTGTLTIES